MSTDTAGTLQLLCVAVATHRCALPIEVVGEIHPAVELVALPDAPEVVVGLANRRGSPVPVLDLRHRLGLPTRPLQAEDHLVVVDLPTHQVALLVDAALEVITVDASAVDEAVTRSADAVRSSGVVVLHDGLAVVLDVATFLSCEESSALDEALQERRVALA